jgi:hypothetical protein
MLNINKKNDLIKKLIIRDPEIMDLLISINNKQKLTTEDLMTERYYIRYINVKFDKHYSGFRELINQLFDKLDPQGHVSHPMCHLTPERSGVK